MTYPTPLTLFYIIIFKKMKEIKGKWTYNAPYVIETFDQLVHIADEISKKDWEYSTDNYYFAYRNIKEVIENPDNQSEQFDDVAYALEKGPARVTSFVQSL